MVRRFFSVLNGWTLARQLSVVTLLAVAGLLAMSAGQDSFIDLWLTHDQQGRRLFEQKEFAGAAERFDDFAWKGTAQYESGQYDEAAETFGRIASPEGFYNRGNSFMKAFEYRKSITAFEQAVSESPDWKEARENLELARYTVEYIERTREQSDTGEESGIGADEIVYDNESQRGVDTEVTQESAVEALSAEKWMRSVDTDTADFLRSRFLLEASQEGML